MYHKTASEGIVCAKRAAGESSARVFIITRELGLVAASARSARAERSKLRFGLEPMTRARFCFVRGQHEWRVTETLSPRRLTAPPAGRAAMGRIARLLLRLIRGQEPNPRLFDDVAAGFALLVRGDPAAQEVETVLVLRVLSHLGYLPHTEALAPYVSGEFSPELSAKALRSRSLLVRIINESLKATGL